MEAEQLVAKYLPEGKLMQLAVIHDNRPWVCTVYYVALNRRLYWLSWPERRHSRAIAKNPYVAAAIAIKADAPVVGLQVEGKVEIVADVHEVKEVMALYTEKYGTGMQFYDKFVAGTNHHVLYRLTPASIVLFDEVHFPEHGRQEIGV